jgi:hypothetical protein
MDPACPYGTRTAQFMKALERALGLGLVAYEGKAWGKKEWIKLQC